MKSYTSIVNEILEQGEWSDNRTGVRTKKVSGLMFKHDMTEGFPLLTTKKMGLKNICTELEFFIKGKSDKKWLQERNCQIWNEWCNPQKVTYGYDDETRAKMKEEKDLGRIYGVQWVDWIGYDNDGNKIHINQIENIIETLKSNPTDRRMECIAWNPGELDQMALPPCHLEWQVLSNGKSVDLLFKMRSIDVGLGLPYNIASYAMLLLLIARTVGMKPRKLVAFLGDVHIYENHLDN